VVEAWLLALMVIGAQEQPALKQVSQVLALVEQA
jgi:hypothetical protein